MKKALFFMLLAFNFAACDGKKTPTDPQTKIEGLLMDKGTVNPISNTRVRLIEITYNGLFSNPTKRVIQSAISDARGQFAFDFQWDDKLDYEIDAIPNNFEKYYELSSTKGSILKGQTNKVDCFLNPYSWVKYKIKNVNPFDDQDTIRCFAGTFVGRNVDKTVIVRASKIWVKPDSIAWGVTKNKILTNYEKQINLVPKDTIDYEINY